MRALRAAVRGRPSPALLHLLLARRHGRPVPEDEVARALGCSLEVAQGWLAELETARLAFRREEGWLPLVTPPRFRAVDAFAENARLRSAEP